MRAVRAVDSLAAGTARAFSVADTVRVWHPSDERMVNLPGVAGHLLYR